MELDKKTVLFVAQYAAPYEGNFIKSLVALESELQNNYRAKVIYVFPEKIQQTDWASSFCSKHKVYVVNNTPANSISEFLNIFKAENPVLVHTHFDGYDIPVARALKSYRKESGAEVKIVWHLHNHLSYVSNPLKKVYQWFCFVRHYGYYSRGASCLAVSQEVLDFVHRFKLIKRKDEVLPNGIDISRLGELKDIVFKQNENIFLAYGGRNVQKRVDLLLKAGYLLIQQNYKFKIIITKGVDTEDVLRNLGGSIPSWLELREQVDNIQTLLDECTCFVSTSVFETFSYAICEASIYGLPVIQSDIEGTAWNCSNPSCFTFKSLDFADLAHVMARVMDCNKKQLAENCLITRNNNINKYALDAWVKQVVDFYKRLA